MALSKKIENYGLHSGRYMRENGKYVNIADMLLANSTQFNEQKTAHRWPQLTLNSDIPISSQRDIQTVANGGTIAKVGAEYRVRATTTANSSAILETEQVGNYIAGVILEPGMGIRVPTQPTGDAFIRWGYYDDEAGLYIEYNSTGLHAKVRSNGAEVVSVSQADWSEDNLSGSKLNNNASEVEINPADGHMWQFPFIYYGYGALEWAVSTLDNQGIFRMYEINLTKRTGSVSLSRPNLPLKVEVNSGTTGVQLDCFIGGRQISSWGRSDSQGRDVGAFRIGVGSIGTSFRPLISFREKTNFARIVSNFSTINLITDSDLIWEIHRNSTLDGAVFGTPSNYDANEIATEWDTSATATYTPGQTIAGGLALGGSRGSFLRDELPNRRITSNNLYTLAVRTTGATNGTVTSYLEIFEEW